MLTFPFPCLGLEASIATSSHELSIPNDVSYIICHNHTFNLKQFNKLLIDTMSAAVNVKLNDVIAVYTDPKK